MREGQAHELRRCACVHLARIRRGLVSWVGIRKDICFNGVIGLFATHLALWHGGANRLPERP